MNRARQPGLRGEILDSIGRPPLLKKGKSEQSSKQFQKRGSFTVGRESKNSRQITSKGSSEGSTRQRASGIKGLLNRGNLCIHCVGDVA